MEERKTIVVPHSNRSTGRAEKEMTRNHSAGGLPHANIRAAQTDPKLATPGSHAKTYTSEETEEAERSEKTKNEKPPARQQIDQQVWRDAKPKLRTLIDNYGKNTYTSSNCTIKSVFPH